MRALGLVCRFEKLRASGSEFFFIGIFRKELVVCLFIWQADGPGLLFNYQMKRKILIPAELLPDLSSRHLGLR